jgi:hypothetical protein
METNDRLVSRLSERYAAEFTHFLSSCTSSAQLPYKAEATITYLRREWTPFLTGSMSTSTQLEFAQAVLRLAECACDSDKVELQSIVRSIWEDLDPDGKLAKKFTDQRSVAILAQALAMHNDLAESVVPTAVPPSPLVGRRPGRAFSFAESFVAGGPPSVAGMSPLASPVERGQDTPV